MIVGPCVGYMIQTRDMVKTESAEGFSPYVSFILIVSNLLRIFWYQVESFSPVILYSSLLMVACQVTLLYFWVKISTKVHKGRQETFWHWNSIWPYLQVLLAMSAVLRFCSHCFKEHHLYAWLLGMASSGVEALLGCPQFKLNYERQHTKGLAIVLIFMWLMGDFYKLSYYKSTGAPF